MKYRYKFVYIAFMILTILWLLFSNAIVVNSNINTHKIKEVDIQDFSSNSKVNFHIHSANSTNSMLETFETRGIVACETEKDNEDKKIYVVLSSDDYTYAIESSGEYSDVTNNKHFGTENIKGSYNGYHTEFSTINMKNGIYDFNLYVWENDENYGIVNTGRQYIKTDKGFKETRKAVKNFSDVDESKNLKLTLWNGFDNESNENQYNINGIAYMNDGRDSKNQNVYVELTDDKGDIKTYPTRLTYHAYINDNVDPKYAYSQFEVSFPRSMIQSDNIKMRILLENEGFYTNGGTFEYIKTDKVFKETKKTVNNFSDVDESENLALTLWNGFENESNQKQYNINGIAYMNDGRDSKNQNVYVELTDDKGDIKTYPATLTYYEYLTDSADPNYAYYQFEAYFPRYMMPKGDIKMRILLENEGIYTNGKTFEYNIK